MSLRWMQCPGTLTAAWQLSIPGKGDPGLHSPDSSLTPGSEASQALSTGWEHFLRICAFNIPEKDTDRRMKANGSSSGI